MLLSSLAHLNDCPSAFRVTEESTGKSLLTCGGHIQSDYFSSRMLVEAGLASCLSGSVLQTIQNAGIPIEDVTARVELHLEDTASGRPTFLTDVELIGVDPAYAEQAEALKADAVEHCFISNLLKNGMDVIHAEEASFSSSSDGRCCGL